MKRILFIIMTITLGLTLQAQVTKTAIELAKDQYVFGVSGSVADTAGVTSTLVWPIYFNGNNGVNTTVDIEVKIKESVSAAGVVDVMLWGKTFISKSYTALDTIRYYGTGTDTTMYFQYTTANRYNIWAIQVKRVSGTNKPYIYTLKGYFKK